ncbi:uncharacterized protein PRCAT00002162001 [Priceomyces carsonii]|uniref:uncharacterized protein n=1 Tax=Priceomyces carsonii TaxID=28549 RepID=UPI002ED937A9|nr:unnamed protein product [Priceomyces carsonii]
MPEHVFSLPVKRVFDTKEMRLRESTKLPRELQWNNNKIEEAIIRVKIIGLNYQTDFEAFKLREKPIRTSVVPGSKIVGKISAFSNYNARSSHDDNSKYLVFPYTNCINQDLPQKCSNCEEILRGESSHLSTATYNTHAQFACLANLVYGLTIDGGLQDCMKIKNPSSNLIRIPENISIHDCCFLFDLMLPFYCFVKDHLFIQKPIDELEGKSLIILNDVTREINDILLAAQVLKIDQKALFILDITQINELSEEERATYSSKFNQVFVFNTSKPSIDFAIHSSISTGLESTRSRYLIVLFDQYKYEFHRSELDLVFNDKIVLHFKMSFKDRIHAEEIMRFFSDLNCSRAQTEDPEPLSHRDTSISSLDGALSVLSSCTAILHSTSVSNSSADKEEDALYERPKVLRFKDDVSISKATRKLPTHCSWLWYEKDFDLGNIENFNEDNRTLHGLKDLNRLINDPKNVSRICYTNRGKKNYKINALLFS